LALAGLAFALLSRDKASESPHAFRFQVSLPASLRMAWYERPTLSPDGSRIALAAHSEGQSHLYVRPLNALEVARLPGTENASFPFWSFDGRRVGFVADGRLKVVDLLGGPAQVLCDIPALAGSRWFNETVLNTGFRGATWSRDGVILFSSLGRLFRAAASGGAPVALGGGPEASRQWPQFLPDGRRFLYLSDGPRPDDRGIRVGSLDAQDGRNLVASDHDAAYAATGRLLFVKDGVLFAQAFDAGRAEVSGEAAPIAEPVAVAKPPYRGAAYSVSSAGTLVWRTGLQS
jgi:hypothetical protein